MSDQGSNSPSGEEGAEEQTWSDLEGRPGQGDLVRYAQEAQAEHHRNMQGLVLWGVGVLFLVTLLVIVLALSFNGISEGFAKELMHATLPPLLASAATIVGVLFVSSQKKGR